MKKTLVTAWMVGFLGVALGGEAPKVDDGNAEAAPSEVAKFVAEQERIVAERVAAEKVPLRRLQMEYLQRQDVAVRMAEELRRAVMTEAFSSPEVERLRAERKALQERLAAVREALVAAGYETEGAKEMKAAMAANEERVTALRKILWPKTGIAPKGEGNDGRKAE